MNSALPINKQFNYTYPVHQELKIYRKSLVAKQRTNYASGKTIISNSDL